MTLKMAPFSAEPDSDTSKTVIQLNRHHNTGKFN
jgi:hypothetical protein